ncbi:hypothetical protein P692DRAFT_201904348 [Suillus brevipes Sb2]|nr:hypothetical protein P692DRAFT_201904348 [Suillus brevipes Sb2]
MTYGGPDVAPENPSPESTKLAESLILVEFIGDLYPSSNIVPADPVLRAKARFFIEIVSTKFSPNIRHSTMEWRIEMTEIIKYARMSFIGKGSTKYLILQGTLALTEPTNVTVMTAVARGCLHGKKGSSLIIPIMWYQTSQS